MVAPVVAPEVTPAVVALEHYQVPLENHQVVPENHQGALEHTSSATTAGAATGVTTGASYFLVMVSDNQ